MAWKLATSSGEKVVLNIIGPDDDFPEDDETLARSLLSDAEGGIVADNAWYSFRLPFGRSVLAASLTLMLVILPVVIIASQEAIAGRACLRCDRVHRGWVARPGKSFGM